MGESLDPVRLPSARRDEAAAVLCASFVDDPGYVYVIPDPRERARALTRFMGALVAFALRYGEVYTTQEVRGVACWLQVGSPSLSIWQMIRTGFALPRAVMSLPRESRERISGIMQYNDEIHRTAVRGSHWYLGALGISPEWQRRGIGSKLLQPVLARADAEGVPCYLETQTEDNVRFYRKQGFELVHEGEVPGHGMRMWAMLRNPRRDTAA